MLKSYIWLQTTDGSIQQVEQEVAMFCPLICHEVIQKGMGSSKTHAISLPERVNTAMLSLILDYCRFHQVLGRSNKVLHIFGMTFFFSWVHVLLSPSLVATFRVFEKLEAIIFQLKSISCFLWYMWSSWHGHITCATCLCRNASLLMKNSFEWTHRGFVSWHQLLTVSS